LLKKEFSEGVFFKLQRGMDKYNGKTNPHGGPGIAGGVQGEAKTLLAGWVEEIR
jgi:hypothetical protein